ncbi:MAG: FAD:protein FMN transferase [Clostridia bacterium]|nr:FAD:protein FMN transferase [Clostridia bacterium]
MKKIFCLLSAAVICIVMLGGCEMRGKYSYYIFDSFDTVTTVIGYESSEQKFNQNCEKIKERLEYYHKLYSIYDDVDGLINLKAVNEEAATAPVKTDSELTELLLFCIKAYESTGGEVNVAMGSVLSIWHEYREKGEALPPMAELQAAAEHTDIYDMVIDSEEGTVFFTDKMLKLDVGAVAKGFAAERIGEWMQSEGMVDYTISIGGNVCALGDKTWTAGIENPDQSEGAEPYAEVLKLKSASLVTSGSYQRFYTVEGKNYHHIIDPDTLMPAEYFSSVSIIHESSAMADVLSTALFNMSFENGLDIIKSTEGAEAMWITRSGEKLYSDGFKNYCK